MDRLEIFRAIARSAAEGDGSFPTSARAALALRKELDKPQAHWASALSWIESDPLLAARVVALANSAAYQRGSAATNAAQAASRLGVKTLKALCASHVSQQLAMACPDPFRAMADDLWARAVQVSALARMVAKKFGQDPDDALFAALAQHLGGFYLLSQAKHYPGLFDEPLLEWPGQGEQMVGEATLKTLEVPAMAIEAARQAWLGLGGSPIQSVGDALCVANALAPHRRLWRRRSTGGVGKCKPALAWGCRKSL